MRLPAPTLKKLAYINLIPFPHRCFFRRYVTVVEMKNSDDTRRTNIGSCCTEKWVRHSQALQAPIKGSEAMELIEADERWVTLRSRAKSVVAFFNHSQQTDHWKLQSASSLVPNKFGSVKTLQHYVLEVFFITTNKGSF